MYRGHYGERIDSPTYYWRERMMTKDRLISISEAAEILGIARATLYQMRIRGEGPRAHKIGRLVKYRMEDITAWIDSMAESPR